MQVLDVEPSGRGFRQRKDGNRREAKHAVRDRSRLPFPHSGTAEAHHDHPGSLLSREPRDLLRWLAVLNARLDLRVSAQRFAEVGDQHIRIQHWRAIAEADRVLPPDQARLRCGNHVQYQQRNVQRPGKPCGGARRAARLRAEVHRRKDRS